MNRRFTQDELSTIRILQIIFMVDNNRLLALKNLEKSLNYSFINLTFLDNALTHSSYRHESKSEDIKDNERLEFLGDAVINFVISNRLYHLFPDLPEGRLAKLKAVVVSQSILSARGKILNLGTYLLLGYGEQKTGGSERNSILGDAFEAVVGAIFLDGGIEIANKFILEQLELDLQSIMKEPYLLDYKSVLQEYTQAHYATIPFYPLINETGPDHNKFFAVRVLINNQEFGIGEGKSKKEAEQKAAQQACQKLNIRKN